MKTVIITGSAGLVGSESAYFFHKKGYRVIGIDNDFRKYFFGKTASTKWKKKEIKKKLPNYIHYSVDIRNKNSLEKIFIKYKRYIKLIIHAAAQPSHDWAAKEPLTDFSINAVATLNLLELFKKYLSNEVFIFVSTNKVYGDKPNDLPLKEMTTRFEINFKNKFFNGVDETMSIDQSTHSLFGVSKCAADLLTQEYGKNFKLNTGVFRLGCITGAAHSGAELHGFLNYLVKANLNKIPYTIFGYKGKQVRDNIHAFDLVNCFWHFFRNPKKGALYNIGGGRKNSCSVIEAINIVEKASKIKMLKRYNNKHRVGDHIWYISSNLKFKKDYKKWKIKFSLKKIIEDIILQIRKETNKTY